MAAIERKMKDIRRSMMGYNRQGGSLWNAKEISLGLPKREKCASKITWLQKNNVQACDLTLLHPEDEA